MVEIFPSPEIAAMSENIIKTHEERSKTRQVPFWFLQKCKLLRNQLDWGSM